MESYKEGTLELINKIYEVNNVERNHTSFISRVISILAVETIDWSLEEKTIIAEIMFLSFGVLEEFKELDKKRNNK